MTESIPETETTTKAEDQRERRRSRSRTRGRRGREIATVDHHEAAGTSSATDNKDAATSDRSDAEGEDTGRKRRRRRGGRGRGRRRSPASEQAATAKSSTEGQAASESSNARGRDSSKGATKGEQASSEAAEDTSRRQSSAADARSKDGDGQARRDAARSSTTREATDEADTARTDDRDAQVEEAIAKAGTRVAAKRGRGGGGRRKPPRPGGVPEEVRRAILEGPPRTMLVTAGEDRTQIAVLEDRSVVEHYVTRKEDVTYVGNLYMARVQNVLPGMEAAFLDIGKGRNGVLYAGEVLFDELDLEEGADERIENVLKTGQKVLVQVTKDPMGTKGPRLTMHLSLAGRYLVLAPDSDLFGISRKLADKERDRLRRIVKQIKPEQHGVIVRTAAEGATEEQLAADLERLLTKWKKVSEAAEGAKALSSVYEEPPLVVKVIRDNFGPEFERCVVDDEALYHQVRGYLEEVAPELLNKVELYGQPTADARARAVGAPPLEIAPTRTLDAQDVDAPNGEASSEPTSDPKDDDTDVDAGPDAPTPVATVDLEAAASRRAELPPLFTAYGVTDQLRKAMSKKVWLPSGGYLIIETTEAMKVIDVNTGKFTGDSDTSLEEVVLKTNLEAAEEIVRQLRLRDIGGIIVIDFIDMLLKANQDQVVRRLKRELLRDRTKTRVSDVSRLGLVQMTRKNVSQGLLESFSHTCEACEGRGVISEFE